MVGLCGMTEVAICLHGRKFYPANFLSHTMLKITQKIWQLLLQCCIGENLFQRIFLQCKISWDWRNFCPVKIFGDTVALSINSVTLYYGHHWDNVKHNVILIKEVSLFQRLFCTLKLLYKCIYVAGTTGSYCPN